jgi:hypothetical protein
MPSFRRLWPAAALCALVACTPALNWRETRPEGSGIAILFPCRPDRQERMIGVAGMHVPARMYSCEAAGAIFSLVFVDSVDVGQASVLLAGMRSAASANVRGVATGRSWRVPGATPSEQSARLRIEGTLPDGRAVVEHAGFFVVGLRLFQVTTLGGSLDASALDTFFGSVRVGP